VAFFVHRRMCVVHDDLHARRAQLLLVCVQVLHKQLTGWKCNSRCTDPVSHASATHTAIMPTHKRQQEVFHLHVPILPCSTPTPQLYAVD
jgi:hypothetical protein